MDYLALLLSTLGILLNAKKNLWCWPIWICSNVIWLIYYGAIQRPINVPSIGLNVIFMATNFYGLMSWKKDSTENKRPPHSLVNGEAPSEV